MAWVDWVILAVLIAAIFGGFAQGFLRSVCSLAGLFFGIALADWNYSRVGMIFKPIVQIEEVANCIGFLVIALVVMATANVVGGMLAKTAHGIGLGCLDSLFGAIFGFLQGALLVMVCIMVTLAFFPHTRWLAEARLPQLFFGAAHLSAHMGPSDLTDRVREGLKVLEQESPKWMHGGKGVS